MIFYKSRICMKGLGDIAYIYGKDQLKPRYAQTTTGGY